MEGGDQILGRDRARLLLCRVKLRARALSTNVLQRGQRAHTSGKLAGVELEQVQEIVGLVVTWGRSEAGTHDGRMVLRVGSVHGRRE